MKINCPVLAIPRFLQGHNLEKLASVFRLVPKERKVVRRRVSETFILVYFVVPFSSKQRRMHRKPFQSGSVAVCNAEKSANLVSYSLLRFK